MVSQTDIVPWRCGRCGSETALRLVGGGAICPRCEQVICRSCRVRVRTDEGTVVYCRECARELGLPEAPERSRGLFRWRRRE